MEIRFIQGEDEIALASGRPVKTIGAVQSDIQLIWIALELVAGQTIYLQPVRIIQSFLAGEDDKPMIASEARGTAFPDFPLMEVHRSGLCRTLLIAASSATRSLSGP